MPVEPPATGRPTIFSSITWDRILEGAELGEFLTVTLARLKRGDPERGYGPDPKVPSERTVRHWVETDPDLFAGLARARAIGDEKIMDDCLAIADNNTRDYVPTIFGPRLDAEHVTRSKLMIETRLKILAIRNPRMRETTRIQHGNDPENPLLERKDPRLYTEAELLAIIANAGKSQ